VVEKSKIISLISLLSKVLIPFMRTLPARLSYPLKVSPPNTITLYIKASVDEWGTQHSVHSSK
jgi:hypothetical protein